MFSPLHGLTPPSLEPAISSRRKWAGGRHPSRLHEAAADGAPSFALGIAARHGKEKNWAATVVTQRRITPASGSAPGGDGWRWYDLPIPADLAPESGVTCFVFVRPLQSSGGASGRVYVDTFELVPGGER